MESLDSLQEFNAERMRLDLTARGWLATDLARAAKVSDMTVSRAMRGLGSPRMMARLARALGYSVKRYLVRRPGRGAAA